MSINKQLSEGCKCLLCSDELGWDRIETGRPAGVDFYQDWPCVQC